MVAASQGIWKQSITIERPVGVVWRALTLKAIVDQYYLAPLGADITAVGGELYYGTPEHRMIVGTVVALEPSVALSHTFRFADSPDATESLVTYRLTAAGEATRLELEHGGYAADSQHFADISMGWPIILNGLKAHLEKASSEASAPDRP